LNDERLLARGRMISRWPVRTGVLIDNGVAYFGAGVFPHETVYVCAVNAADGSLIWRNDRISQWNAGRSDLSPQGNLLAIDELLFVPSGRTLPAVLDRKTGEFVYKRGNNWRSVGVTGGSKMLLADDQLYAAGPHHFLAMDQKSGSYGRAWINGRQMAVADEKAYVATGKEILAVDRAAFAKASVPRFHLSKKRQDLARSRRRITPVEYKKRLDAINAEDAKYVNVGVLWRAASDCESALIVTDNLVLAGGKDRLMGFDVTSGKEVWSAQVEGAVRGIVAANGHLIASTDRGNIYGFAAAQNTSGTKDAANRPEATATSPYPKDNLTEKYEQAAEAIVKRTGISRGFCLVLDSEEGRLAYELARRTQLTVIGVEPDEKKVASSRRALAEARLYGHRVTILQGDPATAPLPNYFADLIVSDSLLSGGELKGNPRDWARLIKPCGGTVCLGTFAGATADSANTTILTDLGLGKTATIRDDGVWAVLVRGPLPGAGDWSHQYGTAANTACSSDVRVKGPLGVLWYGDPGPREMINRHSGAFAPLVAGGRMFIQGTGNIRAYDVYNGLFLWEYKNPGAIRTGVFNNEDVSNLAAATDALFVAVGDTCLELDAATGKVRAQHKVPKAADDKTRAWGFVACDDGMLFGTSTIRSGLSPERRRRGLVIGSATDVIFAVDRSTGKRLWSHKGKHIMHMTISIGDGCVYFLDSTISQQQREQLLKQDKTALAELTGEAARRAEARMKRLDARTAVALDAKTGKQLWARAVDVTDCSRVGIGGGNLTMMHAPGYVVLCGANANGHYWKQFLAGDFSRRRLVVLDAKTGDKLWAKDANYRHRPIVAGSKIIAEPWAFDVATGAPITRKHPWTGENAIWQFSRPGHHCGGLSAAPNMLFFRSGFTGYYDLLSDSGTCHFAGHRQGCWINTIPAAGLVVIPEASAGCVCQFSIVSTVVLEPHEDRSPAWGIYSAAGARTPVKRLAINLGAPGDRRAKSGELWLSYPRPHTVGRLEFVFDVKPKFAAGGAFFAGNGRSIKIKGTENRWIFASQARRLMRCELPLLGESDAKAAYTVKLHFARLTGEKTTPPAFDVRLQGTTVAEKVDVAKEAGGTRRALIRTFRNVPVADNLVVELAPHADIAAIEVVREP